MLNGQRNSLFAPTWPSHLPPAGLGLVDFAIQAPQGSMVHGLPGALRTAWQSVGWPCGDSTLGR
eukprot:11934687-Alexandrium_andersonii.AAC.1